MNNILNLRRKIADHRPQPFTAPLVSGNQTVVVVQDMIQYEFRVAAASPGWYDFVPVSKTQARFTGRAGEHRIRAFLEELPALWVIPVLPTEDGWLCVPDNWSTARERGWTDGLPRLILLEREWVRQLEVVRVRLLDHFLLFDEADERRASWGSLSRDYLAAGKPEQAWQSLPAAWRTAIQLASQSRPAPLPDETDPEAMARYLLEFSGASLRELQPIRGGFEITWEYDGVTHSATFAENFRLRDAHICLAGTDGNHNLSSAVHVMQETRVCAALTCPLRCGCEVMK